MTASTSERLRRALVRMPAPLLGAGARDRLLAFSSAPLPEVDLVYVEYRVSHDATDQVDISLSAAGHEARAALAARVRRLASEQVAGASARWGAAAACLERWATRGTEEAGALRAACLEYDLAPAGGAAPEPSLFFNAHELSHGWDRPRTLAAVCREFDVPLQAAALQFPMAHPAVVSCIPGAQHPAQLRQNAAWFGQPLPAGLWDALMRAGLLDAAAPVPA